MLASSSKGVLLAGVALVLACGGGRSSGGDGAATAADAPVVIDSSAEAPVASRDGSTATDAAVTADGADAAEPVDAPLVCGDAELLPDGSLLTADTDPRSCGGEIAVAGYTPFGAFVPTSASARVGLLDCHGSLFMNLYGTTPFGDVILFIVTRYDQENHSWTGTFQVTATLSVDSRTFDFPATVDITSADDVYPEAGEPDGSGVPAGEVHVGLDVETSCGHITGSFVTRYCNWAVCI
jgi:hypothetical protein